MKQFFNLNNVVEVRDNPEIHNIVSLSEVLTILQHESSSLSNKIIYNIINCRYKPEKYTFKISMFINNSYKRLSATYDMLDFYKIVGSKLIDDKFTKIYTYIDSNDIIYCCFYSKTQCYNIIEIHDKKFLYYNLLDFYNIITKNLNDDEKQQADAIFKSNKINYLDLFFDSLDLKVKVFIPDANLIMFITMLNNATIPILPYNVRLLNVSNS